MDYHFSIFCALSLFCALSPFLRNLSFFAESLLFCALSPFFAESLLIFAHFFLKSAKKC